MVSILPPEGGYFEIITFLLTATVTATTQEEIFFTRVFLSGNLGYQLPQEEYCLNPGQLEDKLLIF